MLIKVNAFIERDSILESGAHRLTSIVACFPRVILPELNTHCVISKNTSSSRAIPYHRDKPRAPNAAASMREMVMESPYLPLYWGKNEAGMQASAELDPIQINNCKTLILQLRDTAVGTCDQLWSIGMHKQDLNRYLEPWGWTYQILTSTEWANFFALRTHKDAHPAFRLLARKMYVAYRSSRPRILKMGEWHLPFTDALDWDRSVEDQLKISVARTARISYFNFDGKRDFNKDCELYEKLAGAYPKHMSPFAHQGRPSRPDDAVSNFQGFLQYRKMITGENITSFEPSESELLEWSLYD